MSPGLGWPVATDPVCEKIKPGAPISVGLSGCLGHPCSCSSVAPSTRAPLDGGLPLRSRPSSFFGMKMEDKSSNKPPGWAGLTPPSVLLPRANFRSVPRSEEGATSPHPPPLLLLSNSWSPEEVPCSPLSCHCALGFLSFPTA